MLIFYPNKSETFFLFASNMARDVQYQHEARLAASVQSPGYGRDELGSTVDSYRYS